ncbi:DNA internalization-related competence protein ComEC/Rec2 [Bacillus marasmi]|uniref:DNA internalization-related competence protein ComEC/Rec2 n=1 Tax=Bacillus marasmi TaxID=1926279 RepID=UPI00164E16BF|nr:DNA internalization-related competence protein ComEC/Rec2 [Bacillus marasmi]
MKGRGIYLALAALFGILSAFVNIGLFGLLTLLYLYILKRFKSVTKLQLMLILFVFILNGFVGFSAKQNNRTELSGGEQSLHIELQQSRINGDLLVINGIHKTTTEKLLIRYRIHSPQEKAYLENTLQYGFTCTLSGKLEPPSIYHNPNVFNYQKYLSTKQIYWIFDVHDIPIETCEAPEITFLSLMDKLRSDGAKYVAKHFPEPTAALAIALLFGDQSMMDGELITSYQKMGIVHLLAISGLQVTFLSGVLFYCGLRIGIVREKMIVVIMIFLPIYALLTGATASVVRAVMMMMVILISLRFGNQRILPLDALCYSFLILLLYSPYFIYDVGFQLSFSACTALLLSAPVLLKNEGTLNQLILTSYIAQLATLPIILVHFFEVSLLSIIANLLFVPFFSIILTPFFFIVFLLHPFLGFLVDPLIWALNKIIFIVNELINGFSSLPLNMLVVGRPSNLLLLLLFISILMIFYRLERYRTNRIRMSLLIVFPIVIITMIHLWSPFGEVTFIDVGQGDSILIRLPYNRGNYLIDTGGNLPFSKEPWQEKRSNFDVGDDVVVPFLKSKGITRLDKLILTHGDMDHIGGATAIIDELTVREILLPNAKEQSELELELTLKARQSGIPINYVIEGQGWREEDDWLKVLAPDLSNDEGDKNNQSIVLYGEIGGLSWLFTGDLEVEGEQRLVQKYPSIDIDVLKVGHHGSKTSSSELFLKQFKPEVAIISVGGKNRYGHPHREIIERYQANGIKLYRTDQKGAISYFFKGRSGTFSTMLP